jgi:hypothetical protein
VSDKKTKIRVRIHHGRAENKIESLSRKMNGANKTAKQFFFIAIKHDI